MKVEADVAPLAFPLRVYATIYPSGEDQREDPDVLAFGLELGISAYGDPLVRLVVSMPWRRPRPAVLDAAWPGYPLRRGEPRFGWRRP